MNKDELLQRALIVLTGIQFGAENGGDGTQWGVCPECQRADWKGHEKDCEVKKLMDDLRDALKVAK